jgi:signal transduction histidine kinase
MGDAGPHVHPDEDADAAALTASGTGVAEDPAGIGAAPASLVTPPDVRGIGLLVVLFALATSVFALASLLSPFIPLAVENQDLDRVITSLAAGIAAIAALLQWNRFREHREPAALLLATALLVLTAENGFSLFMAVTGLGDGFGFSVDAPGQAPIYGWVVARALAAGLFGAAAVSELRGWRWAPRWPALFALGIGAIILVAFPLIRLAEPLLPVLYDTAGIDLLFGSEAQAGVAPGMTPAIIALNALIAFVLVVAATLHRQVYERTGRRQSVLLGFALFIGALVQVQFAIVPPSYLGLVSAGDVLRVAFYVALVLVIEADTLSTLRELRLSRARIEELKEAEMAQAVIEERSRLARDLHDGLAQELWLAKLRLGKLLNAVGRDDAEYEREATALGAAIDSAIAEARLAVIAVNVRPGEAQDLEHALARYVHDVTERLDLPVAFRADRPAPPLEVRTSEEILRSVHEALHNVRKHADATSATVVLDAEDGWVRVSVTDDGKGIEPGDENTGFGLKQMRERVEAMGGRLRVESPGYGTTVILEVPSVSGQAPGA